MDSLEKRKEVMIPSNTGKPVAFTARMAEVFKKEGQNASEFVKELKELSHEDKVWFATELNKAGFTCTPPTAPTA